MAQIDDILKGLEIIKKYDPESYFAAEHDQIYCGDQEKIPAEAKAELEELGWFANDVDSMSRYC